MNRHRLKDFRTDYLVGVLEEVTSPLEPEEVRPLILYELKPSISSYVRTLHVPSLAQTLVQGYYALLGAHKELTSVVVALTDISTTHYFKLRFPLAKRGTRTADNPADLPKQMELLWYKCIDLPDYPPTEKEHFYLFIEHFHQVLNEIL